MKLKYLPLAILAVAGPASAQSSLTLFGTIDATLAHGSGSIASRNQLANSGYNSSRIGFRGTEDLGGGMSASFWLESGVANDDGQGASSNSNNQPSGTGPATAGRQGLTFNRRSTVSLAGGWGELRLGRDYASTFWNIAAEPFGFNGAGNTVIAATGIGAPLVQVRVSNSVGYFLPPTLGGVYGQAQYYWGENPSTPAPTRRDGTGANLRLGYNNGTLNVAIGAARTHYATGDLGVTSAMAQYDFGVARLYANYQRERVASAVPVTGRGGLVGAKVPVGLHELRFSYSTYRLSSGTRPEVDKFAIGYIYNLSKRTAFYTTYARVRNSGGAAVALNGSSTAPNIGSRGFDLGIRHDF